MGDLPEQENTMEKRNEGCGAVNDNVLAASVPEENVMGAAYFIQVARAFKEGDVGRTHNGRFSVAKHEDWESIAYLLALDGETIAAIIHLEEGDVDWRMCFYDTKGLAGDACRAIMKAYDLPEGMPLQDGMKLAVMR